jgi:hypothetical protein
MHLSSLFANAVAPVASRVHTLPVQVLSSSITSKHPFQPLHDGLILLPISTSRDSNSECSDVHADAHIENSFGEERWRVLL